MMDECKANDDPICKAFGIEVGKDMLAIKGRNLGMAPKTECLKTKTLFKSVTDKHLVVINVNQALRDENQLNENTKLLVQFCKNSGLQFQSTAFATIDTRRMNFSQWIVQNKVRLLGALCDSTLNITNFSQNLRRILFFCLYSATEISIFTTT